MSVDQGALGTVKVSVVIPVYNVERYLARCLDSVLAAAAAAPCSTEVICVDDGSTDGSADVLSKYADRVRIITKANGGPGSARNAGLDAMTGDYLMFVDSDDWMPPYAISVFVAVAEASRARLVVSMSFLKEDGCCRSRPSTADFQPPAWRMRLAGWIAGKKVQYCLWNKLYRAELFAKRRFPGGIYEDYPVITDIFCSEESFAAIDVPLYAYCKNAGVASLIRSAYSEKKMENSISVVRTVLENARGYRRQAAVRLALRQAADGHSSTVGQVWKSRNPALFAKFLAEHARLVEEWPELRARLALKAKVRLWRMRRCLCETR